MWPIVNRLDMGVDPFVELSRLQRQMNRFFDGYDRSGQEFPAVNVWGNADDVVVTAEAPGLDTEKIDVTVTGDTLTIEGERRADEIGEQDTVYRRERGQGRFLRSVRLPYEVDNEKITARYENGILRITLPRSEATKPRKIRLEA